MISSNDGRIFVDLIKAMFTKNSNTNITLKSAFPANETKMEKQNREKHSNLNKNQISLAIQLHLFTNVL